MTLATYLTNCVTASPAHKKEILLISSLSLPITYKTFDRSVYREDFNALSLTLGYTKRQDMQRDSNVEYFRSVYAGNTYYILLHQGIEHVFQDGLPVADRVPTRKDLQRKINSVVPST